MINFIVRKQRGFTLVEMLLALAVITALFTVAFFVAHRLYEIPAERSKMLASKKCIMAAMNQYFLDNFKTLKQQTKDITNELLNEDNGYIDKAAFYMPDLLTYNMQVIYTKEDEIDKYKLQLKITPKSKNDFEILQIFRSINPDEINETQAIWYEVPQYKNIAGTIKVNAVVFAREQDNDKF